MDRFSENHVINSNREFRFLLNHLRVGTCFLTLISPLTHLNRGQRRNIQEQVTL